MYPALYEPHEVKRFLQNPATSKQASKRFRANQVEGRFSPSLGMTAPLLGRACAVKPRSPLAEASIFWLVTSPAAKISNLASTI
jgi:hypothetical protein